jgi:hypothetical protein
MSRNTRRPNRARPLAARLPHDPLPALLAASDPALVFRVRRDLLHQRLAPTDFASHPAVVRLLRRQRTDGSFPYPGGGVPRLRQWEDYDQLATHTALLELVGRYGLTRRHPAIARAAEFLFSRQTPDGDFRGMYGTQYATTYTALIVTVLIEADYTSDSHVDRCLRWFMSLRQDDGGWTIPLRTAPAGGSYVRAMRWPRPFEPDRSKPSAHLVTGMVLRAFAAHPGWRRRPGLAAAAHLLMDRFFRADRYADRRAATFWQKLVYPFRWTDLLSALDALSLLGFTTRDARLARAVGWLIDQQQRDGTWRCGYPTAKDPNGALWVSYAACRVLDRLL